MRDPNFILSVVRGRKRHLGITTRAPFLLAASTCLGGACPSRLLSNTSERQWRRMLKQAKREFAHYGEDMGVDEKGMTARAVDATGQSATRPPHTIATFPAIITTTRQDRDGDVLESAGGTLDPKLALLWQRLATEPIGRLLSAGPHTANLIAGNFTIADTALGQDAAILAEHGALRISHGFLQAMSTAGGGAG